jgi:predicted NBD/HSP70 family sugar kinase
VGHTGDSTLLRRVNQSAVLETLREEGPLARSDIARRLQLSPPTITRIVAGLLESGLVFERDDGASTGGRPPTLLEFNARASSIIGVYIGQHMSGALADLNGQILRRRSVLAAPGDEGVQRLIGLIQDLRVEATLLGIPVRAAGIGAPSIVVFPTGVVAWSPTLGWRNLPLRKILEDTLQLPVFIENEVNLIALGESWRGAGRGINSLVCISLGDGIGAGVVLDGNLYRGAQHAAGEIGYIIPGERFLGQSYDSYGCLEGLAGSTGIVQRMRARLAAGIPSGLSEVDGPNWPHLTAPLVLSAARSGDPAACAVVAETVDYLSIAVANLACILNPDRIIISGEMAEFGDLFIEPIRSRLEGLLPAIPDIVLSELKTDAAILGAVATALRQTSDALFVQSARA